MQDNSSVLKNMMVLEDGRIFSLELVTQSDNPLDLIESSIKDTYNSELETARRNINRDFFKDVLNDYQAQRNHLHDMLNRGSIVVPPELGRNKQMLVMWNARPCVSKIGLYAPTVFKINKNNLRSYLNQHVHNTWTGSDEVNFDEVCIETRDAFYEQCRGVNLSFDSIDNTTMFYLVLEDAPEVLPCIVWLDANNSNLYCNLTTLHTNGHPKICIGRNNARNFYNSESFWLEFNTINTFSLGSAYVKNNEGTEEYSIYQAVAEGKVKDIIIPNTEEEGAAWTV